MKFPLIVVIMFFFATIVTAEAQVYLPNGPDAICITLSKKIFADVEKTGGSIEWDYAVSRAFLQSLLGGGNPHLAELTPAIMVSAKEMTANLQMSLTHNAKGIAVVETWDSCINRLWDKLLGPKWSQEM